VGGFKRKRRERNHFGEKKVFLFGSWRVERKRDNSKTNPKGKRIRYRMKPGKSGKKDHNIRPVHSRRTSRGTKGEKPREGLLKFAL